MEIWLYFSQGGLDGADALIDRITSLEAKLVHYPEIGAARPSLGADVRVFPIERYLLVYRLARHSIEVLRVIDGRRDLTRADIEED